MCKVIAVANQKGGVSKTGVCVNLGVGLAQAGERVLLIDGDPQGSLTASLGYDEPDEIKTTLANVMMDVINDEDFDLSDGILHNGEGVDLLPANIELSGLEVSLVNVMSRETLLRTYVDAIRDRYDHIIIDCMPSLGMLTVNALTAADTVLIPVQAAYLSVKGLEMLINTIIKVRKQLNRKLEIAGILLTMVDYRTNYARDISERVREAYGRSVGLFETAIPFSVRAAETAAEGVSIYEHDPDGKVADAYRELTKEVLSL